MAKGAHRKKLNRVRVRALVRGTISPIEPPRKGDDIVGPGANRLEAGRGLPPTYLVYFLFVELLGFPRIGRYEKVAWSIPIKFMGSSYVIEHRKLGLGVFGKRSEMAEEHAAQIVKLVQKGVRRAQPFFNWMAEKAVKASKFNVHNNSRELFERYEYFREDYLSVRAETEARKDEVVRKPIPGGEAMSFPVFELRKEAGWLAMAVIEAFFSWTEHVFIHLAIIQCHVTKGDEVAHLVVADWSDKFKAALDVRDPEVKRHFDELLVLRRQLRNFIAHGAFGKEGTAFYFHSRAGAVPVALDGSQRQQRFSISPEMSFDDAAAIEAIDNFVDFLWSGNREPAKVYIQNSDLQLILTHAQDGQYKEAMGSVEAMVELVERLNYFTDQAMNMDW